ncbi:Aquaporin [Phytophthora palmivora]|uniref:Aquaporin n=1 Tax=Phytophthora palmivora TaxID=4796 RepID=A0A2P4Y7V1_9STRA|nr:Aquaporin [Phytophthora palmivora]
MAVHFQQFPARKVRTSNSGDVYNGSITTDPTPYTNFSGPAPGNVPIVDHESIQADYHSSIESTKRKMFVTHNNHLRECLAEFLATVLTIAFGLGGISQSALWSGGGDTMTVSFGWGVAVMLGTFVADSVSGAHIISVVTVTSAVYDRLPWWKVPGYITAQTLGAFVGAALVYILNAQKIRREDPNQETMYKLFITYARDGVSNYTAFYTEVLACACVMLASFAIKDRRNRWPGNRGTPFALALLVTAISCAFSTNSGLGMSPNRDFGPRLFTYVVGYHMVFTEDSYYFWIPIVAPLVGGIIGGGLYILFIEMQHPDLTQKATTEREELIENV